MQSFHPVQTTTKIGSDHPSLPGHFPGNPVVPGVVILSEILASLAQQLPGYETGGIRKIKFLHPLLAEQEFRTEFGSINNGKVRFKCRLVADQTTLVEGNLKLCERNN